jgi:hypothetical protein
MFSSVKVAPRRVQAAMVLMLPPREQTTVYMLPLRTVCPAGSSAKELQQWSYSILHPIVWRHRIRKQRPRFRLKWRPRRVRPSFSWTRWSVRATLRYLRY